MDRKDIVKRLSEKLGVKAKYLGPPNFDYEIRTDEETYIIDRYGAITNSEGRVITLDEIIEPAEEPDEILTEETVEEIAEVLSEEDASQEENEKAAVITEIQREFLPIDGLEVKLPIGNHTGRTLQNIINMLSSKQHLIMMSFETTESFIDKDFAKDLSEKEINTTLDFQAALNELGEARCPGLTFDFDEGTFTIKLLGNNLTGDKISAFQHLIVLISENARKQMRASFKPSQDDNPKYAMRTWLIRLGMGGPEFKNIRKVLLSALSGSGAFRKVHEEEEINEG
jgi:hypothetical protein